jgi:predicted dehydrogenase
VGYRCQFEPNHLECVRLAKEKVLGDVKVIDANFGFAMGDPTQWRLKRDLAGGGSLMDVGIYCLQTARMLTGEEPVWINAAEVKTDAVKFKEVDETVMWQMKFPSGVVSNSVCTYNANGLAGFRAATSRSWFGLEPAYFYGGNRGRRGDGRRSTCRRPTSSRWSSKTSRTASSTRSPPRCPARWARRT